MKKEILIPSALLLDTLLSPTAKLVYGVLKSFQIGKHASGVESSIIVSHREIMQRSGLSQKTVVKALNHLEAAGWIGRQINWGSASRYIFPIAKPEA